MTHIAKEVRPTPPIEFLAAAAGSVVLRLVEDRRGSENLTRRLRGQSVVFSCLTKNGKSAAHLARHSRRCRLREASAAGGVPS
jgi:hypothetical protein